MALALDASTSGSTASGGDTSVGWSHTCSGANRLLVVGVSIFSNATVSSATYGGQSLTQIPSAREVDGTICASDMWYLIAPNTGAHTVTVFLSGAIQAAAGSLSLTGAHQTTPLGTAAIAVGNSATASLSMSSATGEYCFDVVSHKTSSSGESPTPLGSSALAWRVNGFGPNPFLASAGSTQAGASSVTMGYSIDSNAWCLSAINLKPAPASTFLPRLALLGAG